MNNLKIAVSNRVKLSELTYHWSHYIYTSDTKYQYWLFVIFVMDESYSPILNLQTSDFTFNFLNTAARTGVNSNLLETVYTAGLIYSVDPPNSTVHTASHPLPNPTVHYANGYYLANVQQLVTDTEGFGGSTQTINYPAKYVEIIIKNTVVDVSGDGIFSLM